MAKQIFTANYELLGIRRIKLANGLYAQIATRIEAFAPERLYAWRGRHSNPTWSATQRSTETNREFIKSL